MISYLAPQLDLNRFGMKVIRTAYKSDGDRCRVSKKKELSDLPEHRQRRLQFAMRVFFAVIGDYLIKYFLMKFGFIRVQIAGGQLSFL